MGSGISGDSQSFHLPEKAILSICSFLSVKDIIQLSSTSSMIRE